MQSRPVRSIPASISAGGETLLLDPSGAVWWPAERILMVADLHLEKGSAAAIRGSLLPPWDSAATLDALENLILHYRPAQVIALGDSFHDRYGLERMQPQDAARLHLISQSTTFRWVLGNHDPVASKGLSGTFHTEHGLKQFIFRHEAAPVPDGTLEFCGHHHPKASVPVRGTWLTRPCFVFSAERLMLPAFGTYTGGLDISSPVIAKLFPQGGRIFLRGHGRLFSFSMPPAPMQSANSRAMRNS
ncbi:ligase-associated DNA damage response endonuclease PdeM [Granulibacter bethesdensis]|uniref:ligase-associated DNA damage response endonuclease PdeM n=1 Tax=Granulibacter bethesdensis TaxID=364410 RepID=UPI0003F1EDA1|nr:ligase-associated DNA damage response endonuclease PdeM [Granulibacter bethesdensis]AHJ69374.1 Phosphoesterase family protein [Granulibacter bethesdensis]